MPAEHSECNKEVIPNWVFVCVFVFRYAGVTLHVFVCVFFYVVSLVCMLASVKKEEKKAVLTIQTKKFLWKQVISHLCSLKYP